MYCATVTRPLVSVGQLKFMLDFRFIWSDSAPLLVACSDGLKQVLLEAMIFHNLPVITSHEMMVLLEATHEFIVTTTGALWSAGAWSRMLGCNSLCSILLLLAIQSVYLMMMLLSLTILK